MGVSKGVLLFGSFNVMQAKLSAAVFDYYINLLVINCGRSEDVAEVNSQQLFWLALSSPIIILSSIAP